MWFKRKKKITEAHYQFYANLNPHTCIECLQRHGELFTDIETVPPVHEGCRCGFLEINPEEFETCQEQSERMQHKAEEELRRRRLFETALENFHQDVDQGVAYLQASVDIDIHIEELERFLEKYRPFLENDLGLMDTLRKIFTNAYYQKMDQPKYQMLAPGYYGQLETQGRQRIKALFSHPLLK